MTSAADTLSSLLDTRFSCRAFLTKQVPREDIERMLQMGQRTASWCNSQPWQVHIVSGDATDRLRDAVYAQATSGNMDPDIPGPAEYRGAYAERRRGAGYALYNALGIARDDYQRRTEQMLENYRFFGAPHVAIITSDKALGVYGAVDCGGYVSTLLLAAESLGIAAVPQAAVAMTATALRRELNIGDDRDIVCAISFGYADQAHPANACRTDRASLDETVEWVD
ncbi:MULTISPECIES: nitroreductase [Rhodococcus]|uniref:Nitroreductase n=1 Tax=Rhodococcus pyridinivorans KG-16 TaxID=1441730 RepID=A0A0V9UIV2_9NOCA|nr:MULTISPECIES: nitroreductase [Rhodococcus]KSZ57938.1 nitroreductase [Rhodococcus pyridinivorans KG-16]BDB62986.1 nitroreductase [Rhodococcus sp. RDE2]